MRRAPFLSQRVVSLNALFQGLSTTSLLSAINNNYNAVLLVLVYSFPWQDLPLDCGKPTHLVFQHL